MSEKIPVPGTDFELYDYARWSRNTIADGKWLQENTLDPLYQNELILASAVYQMSSGSSGSGPEHPIEFISNTGSEAPSLSDVQLLIDEGRYVVLQYDDGISANPITPMLMHKDHRGSSPYIEFVSVDGYDAVEVKLTNSGFSSPTTITFAEGKIDLYDISNGQASKLGLYLNVGSSLQSDRVPLLKYEEATNPQEFGFYWLALKGIGRYTFVRSTKTELKFIEVDTADGLTYISYTLFDITVIAAAHNTNTDYTPNTLVTRNNKLWRAIHGNRGVLPENNRVWQETKVADVLGRVKYGTDDAVVDPNNQYKWTVKNNALTEIHYQETNFTPDLEFDVRIACDEVPNFVIEIKAPNGGLVTVKIIKTDPSTTPETESYSIAHYSKSAGNSIPANKNVQITCVGKCWTWEEYIDPTAQQT